MRHIWGSPYVLFFLSPWPHHLQQDGPVSRVVRLQSAFFCALIQSCHFITVAYALYQTIKQSMQHVEQKSSSQHIFAIKASTDKSKPLHEVVAILVGFANARYRFLFQNFL